MGGGGRAGLGALEDFREMKTSLHGREKTRAKFSSRAGPQSAALTPHEAAQRSTVLVTDAPLPPHLPPSRAGSSPSLSAVADAQGESSHQADPSQGAIHKEGHSDSSQ